MNTRGPTVVVASGVGLEPVHREAGPVVKILGTNRSSGGGLQWSMGWWECFEVARGSNT